jgi:hypothetical protein
MVISSGGSYSSPVINPIQRLPRLLRIALLGLSMLVVLGRPIYSTWCETHQLGHELSALKHDGFRQDSSLEKQLDSDHARGDHGLVHGHDGGVYADIATVVTVPPVYVESVLNPIALELPSPVQRLAKPFRPPIV